MNPKKTRADKCVNVGVSMPARIAKGATRKAHALGISRASYITQLVAADLRKDDKS